VREKKREEGESGREIETDTEREKERGGEIEGKRQRQKVREIEGGRV